MPSPRSSETTIQKEASSKEKVLKRPRKVAIGDVGYTFKKSFPGHGVYRGVVIEIRPGVANGKNRRCMYSDGDVEDLSLEKLRFLSKNKMINNGPTPEKPPINPKEPPTKAQRLSQNIFLPSNLIPVDEAAETTLLEAPPICKSPSADDACDSDKETDEWIGKVASLLANRGKSKHKKHTCVTASSKDSVSSSHEGIRAKYSRVTNLCTAVPSTQNKRSSLDDSSLQLSSTSRRGSPSAALAKRPHLLSELKSGSRHGTKVVYAKDEKKIVGEVIMEDHGWVEAVINQSIVKSRPNNFVIVSNEYNCGDILETPVTLHDTTPPPSLCSKSKRKRTESTDCTIMSLELPHESSNNKTNKFHESSNYDLSIESLFYWNCERCTMTNAFSRTKCLACRKPKSSRAILSALLAVANKAIKQAKTVEEAMDLIPITQRPAIPKNMISYLFSMKSKKSSSAIPIPTLPVPSIDALFSWGCSYCTVVNSYKKAKCSTCLNHKTEFYECSILLEIAAAAAKRAITVKEAMEYIPLPDRPAIPEEVMSFLVTCAAFIGKGPNQRRCLKPKAAGMKYCALHCETTTIPSLLKCEEVLATSSSSSIAASTLDATDSSSIASSNVETISAANKPEELILSKGNSSPILTAMPTFLSKEVAVSLVNHRRWDINSIEDAIFCQETSPFPLGMLARRFFSQYGFHDGRIVRIRRRFVFDREKKLHRPVLVYCFKYDDGDNEEFMHHELNSLRQLYDLRNVKSTAPSFQQLIPGTTYECHNQTMIKISDSFNSIPTHPETSNVKVKFCKTSSPWTELKLDLTKLQLNVLRKLQKDEVVVQGPADMSKVKEAEIPHKALKLSLFDKSRRASPGLKTCFSPVNSKLSVVSPILEWHDEKLGVRSSPSADSSTCNNEKNENEFTVSPGLFLCHQKNEDAIVSSRNDDSSETSINDTSLLLEDKESVRPGVDHSANWDPAHASPYLLWDPYRSVICEICKGGHNENQLLLCDHCLLGYHMYCVRPVIVNVPTGDWVCPKCCSLPSKQTFEEMTRQLQNLNKVTEFLGLPFRKPEQFLRNHHTELSLFHPSTHISKRIKLFGPSRSMSTVKYRSLYFSYYAKDTEWVLPLPLHDKNLYAESLTSMVAAMKYCGMESYSEHLVYPVAEVTEDMNDCTLDKMEPMSKRNLETFKQFKHNLEKGAFPPIRIVYDENVGFIVEALAKMPRHTLIAEYVGEVTTVERSGETSSDSLMVLLDTGDPNTSLIIDPSTTGNIARFLSGVNNRSHASRRKANVRTRRFELDGKCRVVLFTAKTIEVGDKLHYDYNSGLQDKEVVEWAKNGFYDTSNFL